MPPTAPSNASHLPLSGGSPIIRSDQATDRLRPTLAHALNARLSFVSRSSLPTGGGPDDEAPSKIHYHGPGSESGTEFFEISVAHEIKPAAVCRMVLRGSPGNSEDHTTTSIYSTFSSRASTFLHDGNDDTNYSEGSDDRNIQVEPILKLTSEPVTYLDLSRVQEAIIRLQSLVHRIENSPRPNSLLTINSLQDEPFDDHIVDSGLTSFERKLIGQGCLSKLELVRLFQHELDLL